MRALPIEARAALVLLAGCTAAGFIVPNLATAATASATPGIPYQSGGYARSTSTVSSNYPSTYLVKLTIRIYRTNGVQLGGARGFVVHGGAGLASVPHSVRCRGTVRVYTMTQLTVRRPDGSLVGRQVRYSAARTLRCPR